MAFKVIVDSIGDDSNVPARFTCDGEDVSPPIRWTGEPAATKSFAIIMDDPDAPGKSLNHWLLWDIPAEIHGLPEGNGQPPPGKLGTNDFGKRGYGGPCPPKRRGPHRYFFRLFALDTPKLDLPHGAPRQALERALRKHAIAETAFLSRYERH